MNELTHLSIIDTPKIRDIDGIQNLKQLVELNLSGNRGSLSPKLQIATLEPVTQIPKLAALSCLAFVVILVVARVKP